MSSKYFYNVAIQGSGSDIVGILVLESGLSAAKTLYSVNSFVQNQDYIVDIIEHAQNSNVQDGVLRSKFSSSIDPNIKVYTHINDETQGHIPKLELVGDTYTITFITPVNNTQGLPSMNGELNIQIIANCVNGFANLSSARLSDETNMKVNYSTAQSPSQQLPQQFISAPITNCATTVQFFVRSDEWGNQLAGMSARVISTRNYSKCSYPSKYVGIPSGIKYPPIPPGYYQSLFAFTPDLQSVVRGGKCKVVECDTCCDGEKQRGYTLYEQCVNINDTTLNIDDFFISILIYSTSRFILSGLMFGYFQVKWLKQKYTDRFIASLATNCEFSQYLKYFVDPQYGYVGYEKYFIC